MNYPVWDLRFGAGLLIALVAILHVFVSHFAVGGGLYLVLTEKKARRRGDTALLTWLQAHAKFFVLVTVVYGAVNGVGMWFTIALISPTATGHLSETVLSSRTICGENAVVRFPIVPGALYCRRCALVCHAVPLRLV